MTTNRPALPGSLGDYRVHAFTWTPPRAGWPHEGVAIVKSDTRPAGRDYGVCDTAYDEGEWRGINGVYDLSLDDACIEFEQRVDMYTPRDTSCASGR